ncbi:MAG: glutamine synthetase family protein [Lachnospiraceae bacterium]|nr:glutamine synthetase family protein [Lachnospiraceae bacterium]
MKYFKEEVLQYVQEEDVKFIRLAFCDVFGKQKNISIMPDELPRAFEHGIAFDASAVAGFGDEAKSDLLLHPEPETLMPLPWRPEHGRVIQMFSGITRPDGTPFECDTRKLLKDAVQKAADAGYEFTFGAEQEFYLFRLDEDGTPTKIPCDKASYMDIAPEDHGENVRREICLTLEQMGIRPESSHHEQGPGQNEIDFRYSAPLTAADHVMMFQRVVKTVAFRNGFFADFSPKPLEHEPGNGFHINMSVRPADQKAFDGMISGILKNVKAMTAFLNPSTVSYQRLGNNKAPEYITWSKENRSPLVRIPAAVGEYKRAELRSPDPLANPYLAFTLMIYAALDGIENNIVLPEPADFNLYKSDHVMLSRYDKLPSSFDEACKVASASKFVQDHIPGEILSIYCS